MTFTKRSLQALLLLPLALFLGFGVSKLVGVDFNPWVYPIILILGWFVLSVEVGIKKFSDLSELKDLHAPQIITLIVSVVALVAGILTLPVINLQAELLQTASAYISIILAILYGVEYFTNR